MNGNSELDTLLDVLRYPLSGIRPWTIESPDPLSVASLEEMVRRQLPGDLYRLKGIVYAADDPDHRYVVHTVGRRSEIRRHDRWGDRPPRTRLVAFGAARRLDDASLTAAFGSCRAT